MNQPKVVASLPRFLFYPGSSSWKRWGSSESGLTTAVPTPLHECMNQDNKTADSEESRRKVSVISAKKLVEENNLLDK